MHKWQVTAEATESDMNVEDQSVSQCQVRNLLCDFLMMQEHVKEEMVYVCRMQQIAMQHQFYLLCCLHGRDS